MSVDRYDFTEDGMEKHLAGDYVEFTDYHEEVMSLKDDIEQLKDAIKSAKDALNII